MKLEKAQNIKMLVMDVDGTLTDGKLYWGPEGETHKAFHVRDGYRLKACGDYGLITAVITGRTSQIVESRARELGITEVRQGSRDKLPDLLAIAEKYGVDLSDTAYIGDDLNDLACMAASGLSACPADAMAEVAARADYVCAHRGGEGAVREFIDLILASRA